MLWGYYASPFYEGNLYNSECHRSELSSQTSDKRNVFYSDKIKRRTHLHEICWCVCKSNMLQDISSLLANSTLRVSTIYTYMSHIYSHTYTYIYTYTYSYIHIHTYIHIHIYIYTVKLLNNGPTEKWPLVNNSQILIALAYFNTFAPLKGGHTWISNNGQQKLPNNGQ